MDEKQAKRKRKELRNAKRVKMEQVETSKQRKDVSKSFKTAFRNVKRSERNKYKNDIKREFGV